MKTLRQVRDFSYGAGGAGLSAKAIKTNSGLLKFALVSHALRSDQLLSFLCVRVHAIISISIINSLLVSILSLGRATNLFLLWSLSLAQLIPREPSLFKVLTNFDEKEIKIFL